MKKKKKTNIESQREYTGGCQRGEVRRGLDWEFGISRYKLVYI